MEMVDNRLCIGQAELQGIVSAATLRKMSQRKTVEKVQRACYGKKAMYSVDSLPQQYRAEVYRRYPDLQERAESKPFVEAVEPDWKAVQYFGDYVLADGRHLPTQKQMEYSNNCAILEMMGRMLERANSHRMRQSKARVNVGEYWERAAASLPRLMDMWPNSLPQNARRLRMKWEEYQKLGYECMISGKYQNRNAAKVTDEEQEAMLSTILSHHNNLSDVRVAEYYNHIARCLGWKEITPAAVGVWRKKTDIVTSAGRLGVSNFRNHKTMQVKRSRPTAPFLMWSLDGWTVELLYQSTKQTKRGNVTTYSNRLTMVVVLDPCINYPIGYAVGTQECPELIRAALRNAAVHSRELTGEMLRAVQIQSDRYAIKTMMPLYGVMGEHVTPARVHNAKDKPVEAYFNYLNTTYCNRANNWSGYGVTTDPRKQPNSEALNKMRHSFPDEEGVRRQIDEMMRLERMAKAETLLMMMEHLPAERRLPLSKEQYLLHFGAETGYRNALEGCGLRPTIMGVRRDYDCFDVTFRDHATERWAVRYDPDDLSEVLAVNEDGTLRYMMEQKYVQPMALADRKPGDAEQLARVRQYNVALEERTAQKMASNYAIAQEVIRGCPALRGSVEERLLITDSRGQHKDQRNSKRMVQADAVEVPVIQQGEAAADGMEYNDYDIF